MASSVFAAAKSAAELARREPTDTNVRAARQAIAAVTHVRVDGAPPRTAISRARAAAELARSAPTKANIAAARQTIAAASRPTRTDADQARDYHGRFARGSGAAHDAARIEHVRAEATSIARVSGHADHVARGEREAAKEHAAIGNEHRALAAGHIAPVPTAKLAAYDAVHAHAQARATEIKQQLDAHQEHAAGALGRLRAHEDPEAGIGHEDLHNPVVDHEGASSQLGRVAGHHGSETSYEAQHVAAQEPLRERPGPDAHPANRAAYDQAHAERSAAYREHALAAQDALEALHGHHARAVAELKQIDREHERAAGGMQREAERHAEHGVRVPEGHPEHAAASEAADTLSGHEVDRRGDIVSEMRTRIEDAHDALREATRSTARTVRELAAVTGRKPQLAGK